MSNVSGLPYFAFCALALTVSFNSSAKGTDDGSNDPPIQATATIRSVECYRCVQWPGTGGTTRLADKLTAIVQKPVEFAGHQITIFIWNDTGKSQTWMPASTISFTGFANMLLRDRAVFPISETRIVSN